MPPATLPIQNDHLKPCLPRHPPPTFHPPPQEAGSIFILYIRSSPSRTIAMSSSGMSSEANAKTNNKVLSLEVKAVRETVSLQKHLCKRQRDHLVDSSRQPVRVYNILRLLSVNGIHRCSSHVPHARTVTVCLHEGAVQSRSRSQLAV